MSDSPDCRLQDVGFEEQVRRIMTQIRPDRQTLLFSATFPQKVENLVKDFIRIGNPVSIRIGSDSLQVG